MKIQKLTFDTPSLFSFLLAELPELAATVTAIPWLCQIISNHIF